MLHAAGFLMSWLTGRRAHVLSISLSVCSHSRLSHLLALLCSLSLCLVHTYEHLIFVDVYIFCSTLWSLPSNCLLPCSNPASVSRSLLLSLPHLPSSFFLHASSFCAMPQGPPGPQGSPHPQPPPPNSMMGPHSQVTLPLPLSLCFGYRLVLSADASCFGVCPSLMLYAAVTNMLLRN